MTYLSKWSKKTTKKLGMYAREQCLDSEVENLD